MCRFLRLLQYEVLRAAEDYEHEKLAQESKAAREKKELVAEKNREKRELTRMRKEETRTRAVLKKEGEKVAKKQRKVESQEAKVARKKAKAQKAKMCIPCLRRFRPVGGVLCTSRMTGAWDVGDVVRSRWIGGGGLGSLTQQEDDFKYSVHRCTSPIYTFVRFGSRKKSIYLLSVLGLVPVNSILIECYIHSLPYKSWNLFLLKLHIGWADFLTNPAGHSFLTGLANNKF